MGLLEGTLGYDDLLKPGMDDANAANFRASLMASSQLLVS